MQYPFFPPVINLQILRHLIWVLIEMIVIFLKELIMIKKICLCTVFFMTYFSVVAQQNLKSPEEFLGYKLGERFTPHYKVVEYYEHVAQAVPFVKLEQYGETYEKRPLYLASISSSENMNKLDQIRQNNLRRAGVANGQAQKDDVAIVWLSYNVHGNESVSTEASMATLYELADRNNKRTQDWLRNTVVLMDPCLNPDGRDRYVNWYNQVVNAVPDVNPDGNEHMEPWPGGRANHYLFDLNRDWAWLTQVESQQRISVYNQWLPHIHVDFHEQGVNEPYYFAPASEPLHELITPWQREFQVTIGKNNAKYFDQNNWLYFTRERFDLFYPSYGDTYPTYNGAIGMTYEQGGSGRAGLGIITAEGDTLTLKDRINHHHTSGLATVEIVSQNATRLVKEFGDFFNMAANKPAGKYKSYVIKNTNSSEKLNDLTSWLDKHEISYVQPATKKGVKGYNYASGKDESFNVESGDILISSFQPKGVLVNVLFEPQSKLADSITYDITAWAVPYIYDLQAYATAERLTGSSPVKKAEFISNKVGTRAYAYVATHESTRDLKWISHLMKSGVKIRFSEEDFEIEGSKFKAGSIIITRKGNEVFGSSFDELIVEAANKFEKEVKGVSTGFVSTGKDFGSGSVHQIKPPKVAVLSGEGVSSLAFGEVWHFFERQIEYPLTVLRTNYFAQVNLSKYDVLILPSGWYSNLDKNSITNIHNWVKNGGRLIAMENALSLFADQEGSGLKTAVTQEVKKEEKLQASFLRAYKNRERESISDYISGSIYKIKLDNSHPLALGYPAHYYTLKNNLMKFTYLETGWNVGVVDDKASLVSGFAGANIKKLYNEALVFGVEEVGKGQIVYMADNPLFRAFWNNGKLLFGNAVFFVGQDKVD
jgi:hypothetical protein